MTHHLLISGRTPAPCFYRFAQRLSFAPLPKLRCCLLALLVLTQLVGCGGDRRNDVSGDNNRSLKVSKLLPSDAKRLVETRNEALAYLENEEVAKAEELFAKLDREFPQERFALQNLVVTQLLKLEQTDPTRDPSSYKATATEGLANAQRLSDGTRRDLASAILLSRIQKQIGDETSAFDELEKSLTSETKEASGWFELFKAGQFSNDAARKKSARIALAKAIELQPDNVYLFTELTPIWLEEKDARLASLVSRAKTLLEPFAAAVKNNTRIDVLTQLTNAEEAITAADWTKTARLLRPIVNVLKPEQVVQSDRLRINKHPLEYVIADFSSELLARMPQFEFPAAGISVKWDNSQALTNRMTGVVQDLAVGELNLNPGLDLVALEQLGTESRLTIFHQPGRGQSWQGTDGWQTSLAASYTGLAVADLDDDVELLPSTPGQPTLLPERCHEADSDVVVFGPAGLAVIENTNTSNQRGLKVHAEALQPAITEPVTALQLVDVDHDGDLDLVAIVEKAIRIYSNRGNLTFEEISSRSQMSGSEVQPTAMAVCDWDHDADIDLLVGTQASGIGWLENLRYGRFRWRSLAFAADQTNVNSLNVGDFDANGSWDIAYGSDAGSAVLLTRSIPGGEATLIRSAKIAKESGVLSPTDFDNDGFVDWYLSSTGPKQPRPAQSQLIRGLPSVGFAAAVAPEAWNSRTKGPAIWFDEDQDGDLDLVLASKNEILVSRNQGGNANHWIDISLRAQQVKGTDQAASGRVNHQGIGSLVELKAGPQYQAQIVNGPVTHFGLGTTEVADAVRVLWTNGVPRNLVKPKRDELICEKQTLKGSCPYLYTWDGKKFGFYTDLLWAAPLGLKFSEETIAPWRNWECLKIDGDRLTERNGEYFLQVTEELWEAAYFDQVELFAVDHPADIDVFTNEKVAPDDWVKRQFHFSPKGGRYLPKLAQTQDGTNLVPMLEKLDGVYAQSFSHKLKQGLATEHSLELGFSAEDLAKVPEANWDAIPKLLFLTGWVYPSDTSINVAIGQNPDSPRISPPSLWIPDTQTGWKRVRESMGFPGGKPKTIVIDLTDLLDRQDPRVKIVSTMELYWDNAWLSVGDEEPDFASWKLKLLGANLHYRGVSQIIPSDSNAPETYEYSQVIKQPHWPPLEGYFTKYGDVTPLVADQDDRLVIMGAGDELTLRFASHPLKAGWKRDFMLRNVGWDKDADINTAYGQTVEPIPFGAMTDYAHVNGDPRELLSEEQVAIARYQTRSQQRTRFWRMLLPESSMVK